MDVIEVLQDISEIRANLDDMSVVVKERLFEILSSSTDRAVSAAATQALYIAQAEYPGVTILYYGSMCDALEHQQRNSEPSMYVLDIFGVRDVGTFVTGFVIGGEFFPDDKLMLQKADGRDIPIKCISIEVTPAQVSKVELADIAISEISQGDRLVKVSTKQNKNVHWIRSFSPFRKKA